MMASYQRLSEATSQYPAMAPITVKATDAHTSRHKSRIAAGQSCRKKSPMRVLKDRRAP
ncbi:hypothetical protein [Mesorhizobium sp.]|uniref:hypothetical protein n=1 Tax=Mesorhizobium sp. TaxID=1871066 RepID=UPI0025C50CA0|nr:hypothetical protein [Mesorhizobium sp.]